MKILRFSAVWCLNCIFMKSIWEELEKEFSGLSIEEFDADDDSEIHKRYEIKDVPTVIFLDKDGKEAARLEGARDKEEIVEVIKNLNKSNV